MTGVKEAEADPVDAFRIDAKAEGEEVVIGGWESYDGGRTEGARWFSARLDRKNTPGLSEGRAIQKHSGVGADSGTGSHIMVFDKEARRRCWRACMRLTALSDNVSIAYVLKSISRAVVQVPALGGTARAFVPTEENWHGVGPALGAEGPKSACR